MALVFIIGPPAVGKMTVGQELARRTGYTLFHNHVAIEVVAPFFSYGTPEGRRLVGEIRRAFFDAFAADTKGDYIFTFVWAFGEPGEREFIEGAADQFKAAGHEVFWVELEADFDVRLKRNTTANRLENKPTKRDIDWSNQHIREVEKQYRFTSVPGELAYENYLRIENTDMEALDVADEICAHFGLGGRAGC
ncbi:MAG: AAA family ATPase [Pseudomonadota bacterium]